MSNTARSWDLYSAIMGMKRAVEMKKDFKCTLHFCLRKHNPFPKVQQMSQEMSAVYENILVGNVSDKRSCTINCREFAARFVISSKHSNTVFVQNGGHCYYYWKWYNEDDRRSHKYYYLLVQQLMPPTWSVCYEPVSLNIKIIYLNYLTDKISLCSSWACSRLRNRVWCTELVKIVHLNWLPW